MNTILVVEDERDVADVLLQGLEEDGYQVEHVRNGAEGLDVVVSKSIDLVILDILLPGMNGLEVCKLLREKGFDHLPILMLTALGTPENVVLGLDSGADDYLGKPFKLIELKARIRTLLRRKNMRGGSDDQREDRQVFRYGFIEIDDFRKIVRCQGQELVLTSTEYKLLLLFVKTPKKIFQRNELLNEVWGIHFDIGSNVVDVYVNYLRRKMEAVTPIKVIHTIVGMGYVLKIEE